MHNSLKADCQPKVHKASELQLNKFAVCAGQLLNNQRHGQGRMQYSNGDAYEGLWVKDHRNGLAKYFYANGDVFVGRYEQNKREGLGTIYMVNITCRFLITGTACRKPCTVCVPDHMPL